MRGLRIFGLTSLILWLSACGANMNVQDFKSNQPDFVLEEYFQGSTKAVGLFEDRFGNVRTQFTVDITGNWDGKTLTLKEDFQYLDGSTEFRQWDIQKTGPATYSGTTQQTIGVAEGMISGNAFNWKYKFNLKVGDSIWKVKFDDWMFLQPDGTLLNKATVYRWGFKIGTVFLTFTKEEAQLAHYLSSYSEVSPIRQNIQ
ncbi:DUF3833 domain-containing protein [Kordiimonas laminariae]|uniref:DUF3833 domain-containing protein n=1 Tax=Kordiimonas laminariae TaxID=2917717 RepID=UPI00248C8CC3|nr:DUF3833 domain-containing protein [Kordiimonas laminariae]